MRIRFQFELDEARGVTLNWLRNFSLLAVELHGAYDSVILGCDSLQKHELACHIAFVRDNLAVLKCAVSVKNFHGRLRTYNKRIKIFTKG